MRLVRKVTAITVSALSLLSALFVSAENISGDVSPETVAAEIPYSSFYAGNGAELTKDVFDGISAAAYKNETGYIEAEFDIKAKGDYVVSVKYYPLEGKGRDIEFGLSIDGSPVGEESSNYSLPRTWKDDFAERKQDAQGNELRSSQSEVYKWKTVTLRSFEAISDSYSTVNLSGGRHTIRVEAFREPFAIAAFYIHSPETVEDYKRPAEKNSSVFSEKFEAENTYEKTQSTLYPTYDRTNASTSPNDPVKIRLNTIGKENWKTPGQSISWEITVPAAGYYCLGFKARQNFVRGISTNRRLYINGEVPFLQALEISFPYSLNWYTKEFANDDGEPYLVYLNKGSNILTLEVVIGQIADSIKTIQSAVAELNGLYREIIMITGVSPDIYRDYYLEEEIPDFTERFTRLADTLENEAKEIRRLMENNGGETSTIDEIVYQMRDIAKKPETVTERLDRFKSNISTLSSWALNMVEQPLELDYITVFTENSKEYKSNAGFFKQIVFSAKAFLGSFSADYNSIGSVYSGDKSTNLRVWAVGTGRDQAQIIKSIIDNDFSPQTGIGVNLSLVSDVSTLVQATLGGKGPDIAMMVPNDTPVNLAFRNALTELSQFEGFESLKSEFYDSAFIPYTYENGIYALPETQTYPMMFIRTDVFAELGIEVPETWDEFYDAVRFIQRKNMTVGVSYDQSFFESLIFQRGSTLYTKELDKVNFDDSRVADAFYQWTSLYTKYGFPVSFDLYNRFRTGEMPLGFSTLAFYNKLYVAAPELRGLWQMYPMPGIRQSDGTVNRTVSSTGTGIIMMNGVKNKKAAFSFMSWWVSADVQSSYGIEVENVMGPLARYETANREAFYSLPWSKDAEKTILKAWSSVNAVEQVPGNYFVTRNITFAYRKVVYDFNNRGVLNNHVEILSKYGREINSELTRKAAEIEKYIK